VHIVGKVQCFGSVCLCLDIMFSFMHPMASCVTCDNSTGYVGDSLEHFKHVKYYVSLIFFRQLLE